MDEDLIIQAIRKALADPEVQSLLKGQIISDDKPELLILLNYVPDLPQLLGRMCDLWGGSYQLRIIATDTVMSYKPALPKGMSWLTCREAIRRKWQRIVLPTCSANTLAKLALGLRDTPICNMAAEGILKGIPVELCTKYLGFTNQTPLPYRRLYESYLDRVRSYGVVIYDDLLERKICMAELAPPTGLPAVSSNVEKGGATGICSPTKELDNRVFEWHNRLMTERDVLNFPRGSIIKLDKSTIVSPLAKDMLVRRRVETRREEETSL